MNFPFPISTLTSQRLWAFVGVTFLATSAHGQFLPGFALHSFPDINSSALTVSYNSTTDTLSVTGGAAATIRFIPADPDDPGPGDTIAPQYPLSGASFTLSANISANGSGVPTFNGGTIAIVGGLPAGTLGGGNPNTATPYPFAPGTTLISGNLTAFGWDNVAAGGFAKTFQFLFTRTGGALNTLFPGNDPGRINLSGWGGAALTGNWNNSFSGTFGVAATTIPEPSQFAGIAGLLFTAILLRRRRMGSHC